MRRLTAYYLAAAILVTGCEAKDASPASAEAAEKAETTAAITSPDDNFDWDKWAAVANENPCNWLTQEELASVGISTPGQYEFSSSGTRCIWSTPDGGRLFSAGIVVWPGGAENLIGERKAQILETQKGSLFEKIGSGTGSVVAIHRRDRMNVSVFPNSGRETVMIHINGIPVRNDPDDVKEAKRARLVGYTELLLNKYDLLS